MNSRGRKPKYYPETVINNILKAYISISKNNGTIKYKDIYLFSKELFEKGEIHIELSEDFWRKQGRQGREIIDSHNSKIILSMPDNRDFFEVKSTEDVVNLLSKDSNAIKKSIINQLKVNEFGYRKLIRSYKELKEKETEYISEIQLLKSKYDIANNKNKIYEDVLFQWSHQIKNINQATTGMQHKEVLEKLLTDMFSINPNAAFLERSGEPKQNSKVVELSVKKKNSLIEDLDL